MTIRRKIVKIDEDKCNGCGLCVPSCAEGAIAVIDGKARLVSETYCDGLGACLGECPQDAISIEEREAEEFDLDAVHQHLVTTRGEATAQAQGAHAQDELPCGCPGTTTQTLERITEPAHATETTEAIPSQLGNWPVQLRLVPTTAPYLQGAKLIISADCVPFAYPDFHRAFLAGRTLLVGCPKLDDAPFYRGKLTEIFRQNHIQSVDVVYMEVPCCFGLVQLVRQAVADSGTEVPVKLTKIGLRGGVLETQEAAVAAAH